MKRLWTGMGTLLLSVLMVQGVFAQGTLPTENHELLKKDAGTWHAAGKMWIPGAEDALEFEGTEVNEMIGEFWMVTDFQADLGGMQFRGHGRSGFNVETEKFEGTWFDSTSPFVTTMSGDFDAESNTMTSTSDGFDAMGNARKGKSTLQYKGDDTRILTMYVAGSDDDDDWVKEMEIVYDRK